MIHDHSRSRPRVWLGVWALALLAAVALVPSAAPPASASMAAASTPANVTTPFAVGTEGYTCFRIPSLVTTKSGALLAFAEGRVSGCADGGHNDIVMKKSLDGGQNWGPLVKVVGANDELSNGNAVPVVDAVTGRVSLMYAAGTPETPDAERGPRTVHVVNSMDEGKTWTGGAAIPGLRKDHWRWVAPGPGHGIQLSRGEHHGRLVITGDHDGSKADNLFGAQLYYSDDGGLTWHMGAVYETTGPVTGQRIPQYPREPAVVERTDGSLYVNARNSAACGYNERRLAATSTDGGQTFTADGFKPVAGLDTPPVYGSLLRLTATDMGDASDRILFSAPARSGGSALDRQDLTIRSMSKELDGTWSATGMLAVPGMAGYSDMSLMAPKKVGMVYETATHTSHGNVRFTSFTEEQLVAGATVPRGLRTADGAGTYRDDPLIDGSPVPTTRYTGKALAFDGVDDHVRTTSCSSDLAIGASDFTVTAWFRYSATSGSHPILWAYDQGAEKPQFWLRAEPGSNRIRALVDTGSAVAGAAQVQTSGAYNDGVWHLAVLTRAGNELRLSVDGVTTTSPTAAGGHIDAGGFPTLHIGARSDGLEHFRGDLDEVRFFAKALTAEEAVNAGNSAPDVAPEAERLRLGFTSLW
ncbi:exo-alpha-sialidase [Streptomyces sp. NPDC015346]|uniref:exo-alpha-sialidase n=1 Tax=Streptomyces sp. NPDC015346 TaxID=3364954 RepID=UPI0036FE2FFA